MASLAINLNVSTKLLKLSFMRQENGKLPTFRSFNCTLQTQKDEMYFYTFWLPINIKKNLKVANPFCPVDDKQFLDQVLKPETVETFGSSLPPKAKRYPNMLKVAKKNSTLQAKS